MGFNFIFMVSVSLISLVILFYNQFKFKGKQDKIAKVSCSAVIILCIFNLTDIITRYKYTLIISAVSLVFCIIGASAFIYEIRNMRRKKRNQKIISGNVNYGAESDKTK